MAITEVHHGCTATSNCAGSPRSGDTPAAAREGVDLRAVTLWSMFGNVDWRSLLTARDGHYDVGAFDIARRAEAAADRGRAGRGRAFAAGEDFDHPVLDVPGWWRRPQRLYPWNGRCKPLAGTAASC
jgi:dTDP-4-dehydrorhamnose reductase